MVAPNGTAYTQLQIGASPSFAETLLPEVIAECIRQYPSVQVGVKTGLITGLTDDLVEGRLDAAIGVLPNMHRLLRAELLFEEEYVLLIPTEHEWAGRSSIGFGELRDRPIMLPTNLRRFPDYLGPALGQHGFRLRATVESANYRSMYYTPGGLVGAGGGRGDASQRHLQKVARGPCGPSRHCMNPSNRLASASQSNPLDEGRGAGTAKMRRMSAHSSSDSPGTLPEFLNRRKNSERSPSRTWPRKTRSRPYSRIVKGKGAVARGIEPD